MAVMLGTGLRDPRPKLRAAGWNLRGRRNCLTASAAYYVPLATVARAGRDPRGVRSALNEVIQHSTQGGISGARLVDCVGVS